MNATIRNEILNNSLKYWQVADMVGISDTTFSKWLRKPLSDERKARVERAINELTQQTTK